MLLRMELLKKESTQIILGAPEYERCAIQVRTLMSAGPHSTNPKWTEAFFEGLPSTFTINEQWEDFTNRANNLTLFHQSGGKLGHNVAPWESRVDEPKVSDNGGAA